MENILLFFFFKSNLSHYGELCSEIPHICLFVLKHYLFGTAGCLQSLVPFRCAQVSIERMFSHQENCFCVYWTGRKERKSGDLSSDFDRILLTPVNGQSPASWQENGVSSFYIFTN